MWTLRRNLSPVLRRWWKRRRLRWWWSDRWGRRCSGGLGAAPCWRSSSPSTWWRWRGRRSSPLTGCYWQTPSNLRCSSVFSRDNYPSFSTLVRRNTMGTLPEEKEGTLFRFWELANCPLCPMSVRLSSLFKLPPRSFTALIFFSPVKKSDWNDYFKNRAIYQTWSLSPPSRPAIAEIFSWCRNFFKKQRGNLCSSWVNQDRIDICFSLV